MRMVPAVVHEFHSQAERQLFDALRTAELGQASTVLHSLNLSRHEYKRWGEVDFVVLCTLGLFCLEVKGGGVACRDGIWVFTDRWGEEHRSSEGPFEQAKSGTYALRSLLERALPPGDLKGVTFGWAVAFPDCSFPTRSVEFDAALVIDADKLRPANGLVDSLRRMSSFWRSKEQAPRNLEPSLIKRIVEACRPSVDLVPLLGDQIQGVARRVTSLTSDQYQFLDALEDAPRVLCQGGAGTGKTFLAVEAVKRERATARSVMVVCRSPVLAEFLRCQIRSTTPVRTARDLQSAGATSAKVQTLIVDEAQDFMTLDNLERLDQVVEGGLERGRWRVFLDPNNQAGIYGEYDVGALELLRASGAVPLKLRRNCRNTEPIVRQTQLATGADIGSTIIEGAGPAVEIVTVADPAGEAAALAARIQKWQDQGVEPGGITVLWPIEFRSSAASLLPDTLRRHMTLLGPSAMPRWPGSSLSFATIEQFKGLENHCIAVIGFDGYDASDRATSELYVAMTRAHAGLWIAMPTHARKLLDSLRSQNMTRLAAAGGL